MLIAPFISALIYPLGSLWTQKAQKGGAGPWRIALIGNLVIAACFMPLLLTFPEAPNWNLVGWPLLAGACFFCGQFTTVMALRTGDVSLVTPMMGCKTLFVALYSWLGGVEEMGYGLWIAALLTAIAVFLLGWNPRDAASPQDESTGQANSGSSKRRKNWMALSYAIVSAAFFAGVDTTVGAQGQSFGPVWMVVMFMVFFAMFSLTIFPFAKREPAPTPMGNRSIVFANLSFGVQALILNLANAFLARPTAINIIYSSRGLTGILAVWFIGHWFGNREKQEVPKIVMILRCCGAALLIAAILIVMLKV